MQSIIDEKNNKVYTVVEKIGSGTIGTAYKVTDGINFYVAKTFFNTDMYDEYINGINVLEILSKYPESDKYISRIVSYIEDYEPILILDYIEGVTIEEIINSEDIIQEEYLLYIAKKLIEGINFIHSKNIAHNDIHSQNLIVNNRGVFYIDFDISCYDKLCTCKYYRRNNTYDSLTICKAEDMGKIGEILLKLFTKLKDDEIINKKLKYLTFNLLAIFEKKFTSEEALDYLSRKDVLFKISINDIIKRWIMNDKYISISSKEIFLHIIDKISIEFVTPESKLKDIKNKLKYYLKIVLNNYKEYLDYLFKFSYYYIFLYDNNLSFGEVDRNYQYVKEDLKNDISIESISSNPYHFKSYYKPRYD